MGSILFGLINIQRNKVKTMMIQSKEKKKNT